METDESSVIELLKRSNDALHMETTVRVEGNRAFSRMSRPPRALRVYAEILFALAGVAAHATTVFAQDAPHCRLPDRLEQALASQSAVTAHDLLGSYFAKQKQFPCAIAEFKAALRIEPTSWDSQYDLGLALLANGLSDEAVVQLRRAAAARPGSEDAHRALGSAYDRLHNPERAIEEYKAALRVNPSSAQVLVALGTTLIATKRYRAAIHMLQGSTDVGVRHVLATAYTGNGDLQEAIQVLRSLLNADASDFEAHVALGLILQQKEDYGSAANEFEQAMHLRPSNLYASVSYLNTLVILQQFKTALPTALELLRQYPHDFSALYLVGLIERDLDDYVSAEPHLQEAVALDGGNYEARYMLGTVLQKLGKADLALVQMQAALRLDPESTNARFQLARILRSLGRQQEAQEQFAILQQKKQAETAMAVAANQASAAEMALKAGKTEEAIRLYRQAIAGSPEDAHMYYNLALVLDKQKDVQAEEEALRRSIEFKSDFAPSHNQLGYLDMQEGRLPDAESEFKKSIAIDSQYAEAENNLGVLYGKLGRNEEAKQLFSQATENDPQYAQAFVNLALMLASESHFAEAQAVLQSALRLTPTDLSVVNLQKVLQTHLQQ